MSFGPSQVEQDAQQYRQNFGNVILPGAINQSQGYINQGMGQIGQVNSQINGFISGIGQDPATMQMRNYLNGILNGSNKAYTANAAQAVGGGPVTAAMAQAAAPSQAFTGQAQQGTAFDLAMRGRGFAEQFGSDLGGLSLQQRNMQTVADKLSSTTDNPFAALTNVAREDAALQNSQGMATLRNQLGAQGLDATSGTGAAALAALQFNTNKSVADAARQNAVQGAQFQQQGLGMAGGLYNNLAGLELQRGTTAAQLGLQGYQADITNAQRYDQMSQSNAQLGTQASLQNAQMATQNSQFNADMRTRANLANQSAQMQAMLANQANATQVNLANAQNLTNVNLANAQSQNAWAGAGLQGLLGMQGQDASQRIAALQLLSGNAGQVLGAGTGMWNAAFGGQQNYMNMMNQAAQASAQGRGNMWGGFLQGGLGLLGTVLGGPLGGAIGAGLGGMFRPQGVPVNTGGGGVPGFSVSNNGYGNSYYPMMNFNQ